MQLQLKPHNTNSHPLGGILLKGDSVLGWLNAIQQMEFRLQEVEAFVIPDVQPNTVWGCLLLLRRPIDKSVIGRHMLCQHIKHRLYIPENTLIYPHLSKGEFAQLFEECPHFLHPALGLVELKNPIQWSRFIVLPKEEDKVITRPREGVSIPQNIYAFQVIGKTPEEAMEDLEKEIFPQSDEELNEKPLNGIEKVQLKLLNTFFKDGDGKSAGGNQKEPSFMLLKLLGIKRDEYSLDKLKEKHANLERRNQKELDKLMEMFEKDPKNALKYAIPLDDGTARGKTQMYREGGFSLGKRWMNFSLFGNTSYGANYSGSAVLNDGTYGKLYQKYRETAENLKKNGDYREAAFVYMKLLKNYYLAGEALEEGKLYEEAAVIYLKYAKNKEKAAWCYKEGKRYGNAIDLYTELGKHEMVGDLLLKINKHDEAMEQFEKVATEHIECSRYLAAFTLYSEKMNDLRKGRESLLQAWNVNKNATNCMNAYMDTFTDETALKAQVEGVYEEKVNRQNEEQYLDVMKHLYRKSNDSLGYVRNIAYEIISRKSIHNVQILSELKSFQKGDAVLKKDILRYRRKRRKS